MTSVLPNVRILNLCLSLDEVDKLLTVKYCAYFLKLFSFYTVAHNLANQNIFVITSDGNELGAPNFANLNNKLQ